MPFFVLAEQHEPKVIAITGGGTGIGRALAAGFANDGWKVAIIGRTLANLEAVAGQHPEISVWQGDVADADSMQTVMTGIENEIGPIDALIANAAVYPKGYLVDQPPAEFASALRINIEGVANSIRPVLSGMLARNCGRIIVMGSQADNAPLPGSLAYSISKGALHVLVRGLVNEIDRRNFPNVLINELSPGATRTAMSTAGHPPEAVYPFVKALIDLPSGGMTGAFFQNGKRIYLNENWKGTVKRLLLRR